MLTMENKIHETTVQLFCWKL